MIPVRYFSFLFLVLFLIFENYLIEDWYRKKNKSFFLYYKEPDKKNSKKYERLIRNGMESVRVFFNSDYDKTFQVYVHPTRASLDSTWRHDWKMPAFKSECWMVASGVATRMDMISPKKWDSESCEHKYAEAERTQQLITHELVHVFHGQVNASPDFSDVDRLDWFIEGLASYASSQCNLSVLSEVKQAIREDKTPTGLDKFWTGRLRYGFSGSMVMFIDNKYGRTKLKEILVLNKKQDVLNLLKTNEADLLKEWKAYLLNL